MATKTRRPPVNGVHLLTEEPETSDAPAAPARPPAPRNLSAPHRATLPGYEGIEAVYVISITVADASATTNWLDEAALKIDHFTAWTLPGDPPTPADPLSFTRVPMDLLRWLCRRGWSMACDDALSK